MPTSRLASLKPVIHRAYSWNRKERFDRREDRSVYWVAFAIEDGSFEFRIGDTYGEASFGSVVICPPNVTFRRRILTPLTFHHAVFTWVDRDSGEPVEPLGLEMGAISIGDTRRLETTYAQLHRVSRMGDVNEDAWISHLIDDIWLTHCAETVQIERELWRQHSDELMIRARQVLEHEYAERLSIAELAASFGLSSAQFSRRYRDVFGTTPMQELTRFRLEEAKLLLLECDQTLEEIAHRVGFSNGFYLSRVFTRRVGESPSRYRASRRV